MRNDRRDLSPGLSRNLQREINQLSMGNCLEI
jgi:hypothetical protein